MPEAKEDTVGGRIRLARERKGMTQGELAAAVGLSQPALQQLEVGATNRPRMKNLLKYAEVLEVSPEYLLTGESGDGTASAPFNPSPDWLRAHSSEFLPEYRQELEAALRRIRGMDDVDLDEVFTAITVYTYRRQVKAAIQRLGEFLATADRLAAGTATPEEEQAFFAEAGRVLESTDAIGDIRRESGLPEDVLLGDAIPGLKGGEPSADQIEAIARDYAAAARDGETEAEDVGPSAGYSEPAPQEDEELGVELEEPRPGKRAAFHNPDAAEREHHESRPDVDDLAQEDENHAQE